MDEPASARVDAWLPTLVLGVTALVYLGSLGGEWVWDDIPQYRDNPAITDPWVLVTSDVWGPTGKAQAGNTPIYRPLPMLSHVPGQLWLRGPAVERVLNLALHLWVVFGVAALALALGATRRAAWFGAALLAWHPAVTEPVAWVSCRADLLGVALVIGGLLALVRERNLLAGVCLALAPFCKESFVLLPATVLVFSAALRRPPLALCLSLLGAAAYFGVRLGLGIDMPSGSESSVLELLGAVGAVAVRGVELFTLPNAPDAIAPFVPHPVVAGVAIPVVLASLRWLPGRPWLVALLGALPLLALAAPASMANAVVSDRYYYAAASLLGVAAAFLYAAIERAPRYAQLAPTLVALPLLCIPFTTSRSLDWRSNERLFDAALARHPEHAHARFLVAHHLHTTKGDCESALPLYRAAMPTHPRAANNYQACLLDLGRSAEAARVGPRLAALDPDNPTPALNNARAFRALGDLAVAEKWAREGLHRNPRRAGSHVLLGEILGEQGQHAAAQAAFEHALRLSPELAPAQHGLRTAQHHLKAQG
jgi:tetratricopeptide (TPR) repeat protein